MKPKRVMHLIATSFYGGPEKQIVEHLKRLNKETYVGIVTSFLEGRNQHNEILEQADIVGLMNYGIKMSNPLDLRALLELIRILRKKKVDILCTHGYKSAVMGWCAAKISNIPILSFSRGYTSENLKVSFYEWLERRFLGRGNGIICVSEGQKQKLKLLGVHSKLCWVVHNAVSTRPKISHEEYIQNRIKICKDLNISHDALLVVSAGRLSPEKGHRFLIEAINLLKRKIQNTVFVFCGDGMCREDLEKQAVDLGVYDRCRFIGFRRDVHLFFQAMDLMVLPSLTEGLPNVILEAFSCVKSVVATEVGGVPEIVEHGKNGILTQAGRPDLLAEAIHANLSSSDERCRMGESGYNLVKEKFSFEKQMLQLEKIYDEVLN